MTREISNDLREPVQMNRLLQGDVGSGKTVVRDCVICQLFERVSGGNHGAHRNFGGATRFFVAGVIVSLGVKCDYADGKHDGAEKRGAWTDKDGLGGCGRGDPRFDSGSGGIPEIGSVITDDNTVSGENSGQCSGKG